MIHKALALGVALVLAPAHGCLLAATSEKTTTSASDDASYGTRAWTNPTNAQASDDTYAACAGWFASVHCHYLNAQHFDFAIPAGAAITNVSIEIDRYTNDVGALRSTTDEVVKLVKGGVVSGNNKASVAEWPGPDPVNEATATYSYTPAQWGVTLLPSDVNADTFGVVLAVQATCDGCAFEIDVDAIRIEITYSYGHKILSQAGFAKIIGVDTLTVAKVDGLVAP